MVVCQITGISVEGSSFFCEEAKEKKKVVELYIDVERREGGGLSF